MALLRVATSASQAACRPPLRVAAVASLLLAIVASHGSHRRQPTVHRSGVHQSLVATVVRSRQPQPVIIALYIMILVLTLTPVTMILSWTPTHAGMLATMEWPMAAGHTGARSRRSTAARTSTGARMVCRLNGRRDRAAAAHRRVPRPRPPRPPPSRMAVRHQAGGEAVDGEAVRAAIRAAAKGLLVLMAHPSRL